MRRNGRIDKEDDKALDEHGMETKEYEKKR
jgi:hypothetical protein